MTYSKMTKKLKKIFKITSLILSALILLLIIASSINNRIGNSKVEGDIRGLGTTIAMVTGGTNSYNKTFFKLILVFKGKFSFNANLNEPGGGKVITRNMFYELPNGRLLSMRSRIINFDLNPNEQIKIEGQMKPYSIDYRIEGNVLSQQHSLFRKENLEILENETKTGMLIAKLKHEKSNKHTIDSTQALFDKIRANYNYKRLEFAKSNPSLEVAANYLQSQEKDSIIRYFPLLSQKVKESTQGQLLQERIKAWNQVDVGKLAPSFSSTTIAGKAFHLSDLQGKYVVLDFWGSWCGPCIKEFPKMKEYYKKYEERVEFVGIACKDENSNWRRAVKETGISWIQILNNESDDLAIKYTIEAYPTQVLIDPKGKIVQVFRKSEEFYKWLDKLFVTK